jgi:hypothetical protein
MSTELTQLDMQHEVILHPGHEDIVNAFSKPALARRTAETYAGFARRFDEWRIRNSYPLTFPVEPRVVIAWLADLALAQKAPSTSVALAAIKYLHAQKGSIFDGGPAVANALRHIRRGSTNVPDQAEPLRQKLLVEILRRPIATPLDVRDNCLLSLGYIFALRREELASMDYMQLGAGRSVLDVGPEALTVTFVKSKTSQEGVETVAVPRDSNPRAAGAIMRWLREAGIEPGTPVLRQVRPRGHAVTDRSITGDLVSRVIRHRVAEHYLSLGNSEKDAAAKAALYSGHSARVGFVVSATEAGLNPERIGRVTRHRPGSAMVRRYSAKAEQIKHAPHNAEGVGL